MTLKAMGIRAMKASFKKYWFLIVVPMCGVLLWHNGKTSEAFYMLLTLQFLTICLLIVQKVLIQSLENLNNERAELIKNLDEQLDFFKGMEQTGFKTK